MKRGGGSRRSRSAWLVIAACCVLAPLKSPAQPSPTPATSESISAQHAEAERSKMYEAGLTYSRWVDGVAERSGSEFLQRPVFDRVTWMRLLACAGSLP